MALVATAIGIYDQSGGTTITLSRSDIFNGATPKAAIVTALGGNNYAYNADINQMRYSIGAVTDSAALGCGIVSFNNVYPANARRIASDSNPIIIPSDISTTFGMKMSGTLVSDGITFTKVGTWASSGDLAIQVILLGGSDFDAYLPSNFVSSTTVNKDIPFLPNAAMVFGCDIPDGNSVASGVLSQGFVVDKGDGSAEEMSRRTDFFTTTAPTSKISISNNEFYANIGGATSNIMTHVDFAQDDLGNNPVTYEHNYTTANSTSTPYYCPLYMKFNNEDVGLQAITLPTTTGVFTKSNYGFNPAVINILGNTGTTAYNTSEQNNNTGNSWDWCVEGSGYTSQFNNRNSVNPTETYTKASLGTLLGFKDGGGATSFEGSTTQRITGGFSVDFTSVTGSTGYTIGMAMGTPAEGGLNIALGSDAADKVYLGATEVSGAYLGSDSIGSAGGGWRTFYSDPSPAQNESDWRAGTSGTLSQVAGGILWTCTIAGVVGTTFDFTTVTGKDYRLTITIGAGSVLVNNVVQDTTGTAVDLADTVLINAGGGSATMTFKAIGNSTTLTVFTFAAVGATILIDSLLIEEMG